MDLEQILIFLVVGLVAGWLAGLIIKGGGFGILGNMIIGIIGAVLGGWLFGVMDVSIGGRWLGPIVMATVGAVVLLLALGFGRKKK